MSKTDSGRGAGDNVTLAELVAYAEGRLPRGLDDRARVEAWLHDHPEDAARVQSYMRQDRFIRATWGDVTTEPIPTRLQPAGIARHRKRPHGQWMRPAAVAAALVLATVTGFLAGRADLADPTPGAGSGTVSETASEDALGVESGDEPGQRLLSEPNERQAGDEDTHGVAATADAHGAPDLSDLGMRFMGGDAGAAHGVEEFHYTGPYGETVHLFRSTDTDGEPGVLRTLKGDRFNLVYWKQGGSTLALAGPVDVDHLQALALRSMSRLTGETPLHGSAPRPAADGPPPGIVLDRLQAPELHIAPVPEMMPMPATSADGV